MTYAFACCGFDLSLVDLLTSIFHVGLGHIRVGPIITYVLTVTQECLPFYAALVKKMLQKLPYNNRLLKELEVLRSDLRPKFTQHR